MVKAILQSQSNFMLHKVSAFDVIFEMSVSGEAFVNFLKIANYSDRPADSDYIHSLIKQVTHVSVNPQLGLELHLVPVG